MFLCIFDGFLWFPGYADYFWYEFFSNMQLTLIAGYLLTWGVALWLLYKQLKGAQNLIPNHKMFLLHGYYAVT